ncbi:unnamed protein product [Zymoseptoria tritici ST99CH_1E4]|uniref:C2H2-type domain-containing protein n=1 Tax=Zymoseptoria tritici ST99CH_1E4 TaxID=1276532 RepID=A0A2H1GHU9_ZYMTR|nr:unnamed protein product [Zymoseptoria tritici ST99CH_1E4]
MYECDTCNRYFGSQAAANQHMNALNHWTPTYECETCSNEYYDEEDCWEHMDDEQHWGPRIECEACNAMFHSHQDARRHMDSLNHWRTHWCRSCQRGFQNLNNLRMHQNGAAHRANSICCPFCQRPYTTASGVAHRLESASCPSAPNLNRESIYHAINRLDTRGAITNNLLTWNSSSNASYEATNATWNGRAFECYLCHRGFGSLGALNQHLSSPVHKQKVYHCFGRGCERQFTALAQLFGHLESESCGATKFADVQRGAQGVLTGQRMLGV